MPSLLSQKNVLGRSHENSAHHRHHRHHHQQAVPTKGKETPCPPKPPRSAFICFKDSTVAQHDGTLAAVATQWRSLNRSDRAYWDEISRQDKMRFVREKESYKGPVVVPQKRSKKNPLAPKRPMSAFLKYSKVRRGAVKADNPDMGNTDISRLLGEMWRTASKVERAPFVETEEKERADYNERVRVFREKQANHDNASRTNHEDVRTEVVPESTNPSTCNGDEDDSNKSPEYSNSYSFANFEPSFSNSGNDNDVAAAIDRGGVFRPYRREAAAVSSDSKDDKSEKLFCSPPYQPHHLDHGALAPPYHNSEIQFRPHGSSDSGDLKQNSEPPDSITYSPRHSYPYGPPVHHYPYPPPYRPPAYANAENRSRNSEAAPSLDPFFNDIGSLSPRNSCEQDPNFNQRQSHSTSSHYYSNGYHHYG